MSLKISEDFYSIQGEGKTTGSPAYFVRLTECNLTCGATQKILNQMRKGELSVDANANWHGDLHIEGKATWTCDSIPVWIKGVEQNNDYLITMWKLQGIYEDICSGICHIIWTGGEPTLPQHQASIIEFLRYLALSRYGENGLTYTKDFLGIDEKDLVIPGVFNEIETNGTRVIQGDLLKRLQQINCSPKLSNSGMTVKQRIVPEAIQRIMEHKNYQFKFVIFNEDDIKEMFRDFIDPFNIPLKNVTCMPALDNQEDYHERTNFICEMAKKYKFIAAQRLHISSWGATTGV